MYQRHDETNVFYENSTETLRKYAIRTFSWMGLGLVVTFLVAYLVLTTNLIYLIYGNSIAPFVIIIAQLGVAVAFGARLSKMSVTSARVLFLVYAALLGLTFSSIGLQYNITTIIFAFLITAVYFASLIVIGFTTKMNLLRLGPIFIGGLVTLIIVELIMMLMGVSTDTMLFSALGLILFTGLTAFDAQKMSVLYYQNEGNTEALKTLSIYSAFELYLDFINIFLYILRFLKDND